MRTFCGAVTETNDRGVVAEHCPHCDSLKTCLLRTVSQGNYIFFAKVAEMAKESSCLCTECHKPFPGKPYWSYAEIVPVRDARDMKLDDLLAKTNPILEDRIRFREQIQELGGDHRYAVAYDNIEGMRNGWLRLNFLKKLRDWSQLEEAQRNELDQQIGAMSRAWKFARHMGHVFPTSSGSMFYYLSVPVFGLILIWMLFTRNWIPGVIALAISAFAATMLESQLFQRVVRQWTRNILIPEAKEANIPLEDFVAVIDDIPESKHGMTEELWPIKHQLPTIRATLTAENK